MRLNLYQVEVMKIKQLGKIFISFCSKSIFDANIREKVDCASFISVLRDDSADPGIVEKNAFTYCL